MLDAYLRRYSPCDWPCSPCRRTHSSVASSVRPLQPLPLLHTPLPFTTESCLRSVGCFSRVASSESCCIWIFRGDGLLLWRFLTRQRFHLDQRSLHNTNRKSYLASRLVTWRTVPTSGNAANRVWYVWPRHGDAANRVLFITSYSSWITNYLFDKRTDEKEYKLKYCVHCILRPIVRKTAKAITRYRTNNFSSILAGHYIMAACYLQVSAVFSSSLLFNHCAVTGFRNFTFICPSVDCFFIL